MGIGLIAYGKWADYQENEGKKQLIIQALELYKKEHESYPQNLEKLVESQFINKIPLKSNQTPYIYSPMKEKNVIMTYNLN